MNLDKEYERKYKTLKKKLKYLIYENEAFTHEIHSLEKKVVQVQRDKNFLLERLLQYESGYGDGHTTDPEETESSDGETKPETKKKKLKAASQHPVQAQAKKRKLEKKQTDIDRLGMNAAYQRSSNVDGTTSGHMYQRLSDHHRMLSFNPNHAPTTVPAEMFNTDSSHNESEFSILEDI
ncbi:uncharacterized protein LOC136031968 [Artemia franciscana]|uniref:uncharacterized protein LOC136031968 n=1 Tax=Artemia franciscana TaxID=6661 RepID=UPI0032DBD9A3